MRRTVRALAAFPLILAAPVEAADEEVLEPASTWNATYEDGRCRLSRMFGGEGQKHALVFEQTAPQSRFHMSVAGPGVAAINDGLPLRLAFGPHGAESDQTVVKERNPDFGAVLFLKDIDLRPADPGEVEAGAGLAEAGARIDVDSAAPLRQVSLTQGKQQLVFRTGPLAAPFGVLNDCTAHILSTWGIDPEAQRTAQRGTRLMDPQKAARKVQGTYPLQPLLQGRGGVVGVAILVDDAGTPTECRITNDSGDCTLNAVACEALMKARYDPALDAAGKPMKSYWMTRVIYRVEV